MERITITQQEVEAIAIKRGFILPHKTVNEAIAGDYTALLTNEELTIANSPKELGYQAMKWLRIPQEERAIITSNKAVELLKR